MLCDKRGSRPDLRVPKCLAQVVPQGQQSHSKQADDREQVVQGLLMESGNKWKSLVPYSERRQGPAGVSSIEGGGAAKRMWPFMFLWKMEWVSIFSCYDFVCHPSGTLDAPRTSACCTASERWTPKREDGRTESCVFTAKVRDDRTGEESAWGRSGVLYKHIPQSATYELKSPSGALIGSNIKP